MSIDLTKGMTELEREREGERGRGMSRCAGYVISRNSTLFPSHVMGIGIIYGLWIAVGFINLAEAHSDPD